LLLSKLAPASAVFVFFSHCSARLASLRQIWFLKNCRETAKFGGNLWRSHKEKQNLVRFFSVILAVLVLKSDFLGFSEKSYQQFDFFVYLFGFLRFAPFFSPFFFFPSFFSLPLLTGFWADLAGQKTPQKPRKKSQK